jgi:hypothetical protein
MPGVTVPDPAGRAKWRIRLLRAAGSLLLLAGAACVYWLPANTGSSLVTPEQCAFLVTAVICLVAATLLLGYE